MVYRWMSTLSPRIDCRSNDRLLCEMAPGAPCESGLTIHFPTGDRGRTSSQGAGHKLHGLGSDRMFCDPHSAERFQPTARFI